MRPRMIRRVALVAVLLLGFAQSAIALAGCIMERGTPMQMSSAGEACDCDAQGMTGEQSSVNVCIAHCTADLQIAGLPIVLVRSPGEATVFTVPPSMEHEVSRLAIDVPPPRSIAARILLHSFLI